VIIPFCTNLVIRTYAWMLLLGNGMPPARLAQALGLIGPGQALYPSTLALYVGMVSNSLPFAVLPIYTNVEKLDWEIVEASRDLYGGAARTFLHAVLPQTLPGLATAVILTFIPAMGAFLIPDILGGGKTWMLGNLIQHQFGVSRDFPFGAAVSLILTVLTLLALLVARGRSRKPVLP
jgi:spermidine/putrescine transport system permease protein